MRLAHLDLPLQALQAQVDSVDQPNMAQHWILELVQLVAHIPLCWQTQERDVGRTLAT